MRSWRAFTAFTATGVVLAAACRSYDTAEVTAAADAGDASAIDAGDAPRDGAPANDTGTLACAGAVLCLDFGSDALPFDEQKPSVVSYRIDSAPDAMSNRALRFELAGSKSSLGIDEGALRRMLVTHPLSFAKAAAHYRVFVEESKATTFARLGGFVYLAPGGAYHAAAAALFGLSGTPGSFNLDGDEDGLAPTVHASDRSWHDVQITITHGMDQRVNSEVAIDGVVVSSESFAVNDASGDLLFALGIFDTAANVQELVYWVDDLVVTLE